MEPTFEEEYSGARARKDVVLRHLRTKRVSGTIAVERLAAEPATALDDALVVLAKDNLARMKGFVQRDANSTGFTSPIQKPRSQERAHTSRDEVLFSKLAWLEEELGKAERQYMMTEKMSGLTATYSCALSALLESACLGQEFYDVDSDLARLVEHTVSGLSSFETVSRNLVELCRVRAEQRSASVNSTLPLGSVSGATADRSLQPAGLDGTANNATSDSLSCGGVVETVSGIHMNGPCEHDWAMGHVHVWISAMRMILRSVVRISVHLEDETELMSEACEKAVTLFDKCLQALSTTGDVLDQVQFIVEDDAVTSEKAATAAKGFCIGLVVCMYNVSLFASAARDECDHNIPRTRVFSSKLCMDAARLLEEQQSFEALDLFRNACVNMNNLYYFWSSSDAPQTE